MACPAWRAATFLSCSGNGFAGSMTYATVPSCPGRPATNRLAGTATVAGARQSSGVSAPGGGYEWPG